MDYGDRILIARRRRGLRQEALARLAGVNPQTIVDIERRRIEITEAEYHRIMAAMQTGDQPAIAAH